MDEYLEKLLLSIDANLSRIAGAEERPDNKYMDQLNELHKQRLIQWDAMENIKLAECALSKAMELLPDDHMIGRSIVGIERIYDYHKHVFSSLNDKIDAIMNGGKA